MLRDQSTDRLQLKGIAVKSVPYSDFGLESYGGVLFASRNYVEANRDLLVHYFAGLLGGVDANVADPKAVLPLLKAMDPNVDLAYSEAGNRAYNALLDSDYTETHGRLMVDPAFGRARCTRATQRRVKRTCRRSRNYSTRR